MNDIATGEKIKKAVRQTYGEIANRSLRGTEKAGCCSPARPASCCGPAEAAVEITEAARLYSTEELAGLPESVTGVSLGCGNPTAIAELRPGEVVSTWARAGELTASWPPRRSGRRGG